MPDREYSSLDRFINARGPVLAGVVDDARRIERLGLVSVTLGLMGLFLLLRGYFGGFEEGVWAAGVPFLAASAAMGAVRQVLKGQFRSEHTTQASLSPEAQRLVRELVGHLEGWPLHRLRRRRRLRRAMERGLPQGRHDRRCEDLLGAETFRVLDAGARHYNRVYASLSAAGDAAGTSLERLGPEIVAAADEAMAGLLHQAALLHRFPENGTAMSAAQARLAELGELAGHVDRLLGAGPGAAALPESAGRVADVLEALRADRLAREELEEVPPVQRQGHG